jgi:hypothetical protein
MSGLIGERTNEHTYRWDNRSRGTGVDYRTSECDFMRNRIKCLKCGDVIESKSRHDFVWCKCKSVAVDGGSGNGYMRRIGTDYEEVEEWPKNPLDMCGNE